MRLSVYLLLASIAVPSVAQQFAFPVDSYNVTGYHFAQQVAGSGRHLGEDAHATIGIGTPVRAVSDGVIILSKTKRQGYGQYVVISHSSPSPFVSVYGHLSRQPQYPLRGVGTVKQNDIIGYIGSQDENGGWSPHLHFAVYKKAPDGIYHYWGNAPNDTGDDVDFDASGNPVGGFFTKPSVFLASSPPPPPPPTGTITIDFEHFPDASGLLTVPTPTNCQFGMCMPLNTQYSQLGVTLTTGYLWFNSGCTDPFFCNNHFWSTTEIGGTFSVPVYSVGVDSKSYWTTMLTTFDSLDTITGTAVLSNPTPGVQPVLGTLRVSSAQPIARFTVVDSSRHIFNIDNLVYSTTPALPNQSPTAGFSMTSIPLQPVPNGQTLNLTVSTGRSATVFFDGASPRSNDPDGTVTGWRWTVNGTEVATIATFSGTFTAGTYNVSLVVTDNQGAPSQVVAGTVIVRNVPVFGES